MTQETVQLSDKASSLFHGNDEDREKLLALHKAYLDANSNTLNGDDLRKIWSHNPDCVWFNSTGYTYFGIEDWISLWQYFGQRVEITEPWRSTDVRLIGNGDVAAITCERTAGGRWKSESDEPHWTGGEVWPSRSTEVFMRENGTWKCVHVHISSRETDVRHEQRR